MALEDPAKIIMRDVGRRIAELRERVGLSQARMAELLDIEPRPYQRIEQGTQNLTLRTMVKISGVLKVQVRELLDEPASRDPKKRGRPRRVPPAE